MIIKLKLTTTTKFHLDVEHMLLKLFSSYILNLWRVYKSIGFYRLHPTNLYSKN